MSQINAQILLLFIGFVLTWLVGMIQAEQRYLTRIGKPRKVASHWWYVVPAVFAAPAVFSAFLTAILG